MSTTKKSISKISHEKKAIKKEGHFVNDSAEKWWIFYEIGGRKKSKFQYVNNKKNGYCLRYENGSLKRAESYKDGKKLNEWTSYRAFRKDNPDVSIK